MVFYKGTKKKKKKHHFTMSFHMLLLKLLTQNSHNKLVISA